MSIDVLQNKIRKLKNPAALWLCPAQSLIPAAVLEEAGSLGKAYGQYALSLLENLQEYFCAVRVNFDAFALAGVDGLVSLERVLDQAKKLGYYVILDWMHMEDPASAEQAAKVILKEGAWPCDAVVVTPYGGSEGVKPYLSAAGKKDVFVAVKTGNKSASELQDLQTGGRQVYIASAELVSIWGEMSVERFGYSRVAAVAGAANASALRILRQKFPRLFMLVEGLETTGANVKNCSYAFDRMGYGALVCAGSSILGAWKEREDGDYLEAARDASDRLKRNLSRYVTVL